MFMHKYKCPNCEEDFESRRKGRKFCSMPCAAESKTKKFTCKRGHALTSENTYLYRGRRNCRTCKNASAQRWSDRNPEYELAKQRRYRERHRVELNERVKKWNRDNPDKKRSHQLVQYGLTLEDFETMKEKQNSLCAICKIDKGKILGVDHDHMTGNVRGLLCSTCNSGIGMLKDNTDLLKSAISYLDEHSSIKENTHGS